MDGEGVETVLDVCLLEVDVEVIDMEHPLTRGNPKASVAIATRDTGRDIMRDHVRRRTW